MPDLPATNDTLIAHKVINLSGNLTANDKRVAGLIIDHFNRKTGQCDPGIERLARLLGISPRTVVRSVERLAELGHIHRTRHGGKSQRNSYQPDWQHFREIDLGWKLAMSGKPSVVTVSAHRTRQSCHFGDDKSVTQTLPINQSVEPVVAAQTSPTRRPPRFLPRSNGSAMGRMVQGSRPPYSSMKKPLSSAEAAIIAAERRISATLSNRMGADVDRHADVLAAIDRTLMDAAVEAELKRPGSGIDHLLSGLRGKDQDSDGMPVPTGMEYPR